MKRDIALKSSGDVAEIEKNRALDDLATSIVAFNPALGRNGARQAKELARRLSSEFDTEKLKGAREDRDKMVALLSAVGHDTRSAAQRRAALMARK